jgi:hypothetical protein
VCRCEKRRPDFLCVIESLSHLQRASKHTFENAIVPLDRLKVGLEALEEEFSMQPPTSPHSLAMPTAMELPCKAQKADARAPSMCSLSDEQFTVNAERWSNVSLPAAPLSGSCGSSGHNPMAASKPSDGAAVATTEQGAAEPLADQEVSTASSVVDKAVSLLQGVTSPPPMIQAASPSTDTSMPVHSVAAERPRHADTAEHSVAPVMPASNAAWSSSCLTTAAGLTAGKTVDAPVLLSQRLCNAPVTPRHLAISSGMTAMHADVQEVTHQEAAPPTSSAMLKRATCFNGNMLQGCPSAFQHDDTSVGHTPIQELTAHMSRSTTQIVAPGNLSLDSSPVLSIVVRPPVAPTDSFSMVDSAAAKAVFVDSTTLTLGISTAGDARKEATMLTCSPVAAPGGSLGLDESSQAIPASNELLAHDTTETVAISHVISAPAISPLVHPLSPITPDAPCGDRSLSACVGISISAHASNPLTHALSVPAEMHQYGSGLEPPMPAQGFCQEEMSIGTLSSPLPAGSTAIPLWTPVEKVAVQSASTAGTQSELSATRNVPGCPVGERGTRASTGAVSNTQRICGHQPVSPAAAAASGGGQPTYPAAALRCSSQLRSPPASPSCGSQHVSPAAALSCTRLSGREDSMHEDCQGNHVGRPCALGQDKLNSGLEMFADIFGDCEGTEEAQCSGAEHPIHAEPRPPLPPVPLRKTLATKLDMIQAFRKRKNPVASAARKGEECATLLNATAPAVVRRPKTGTVSREAPKEVLVDFFSVIWPPVPMLASSVSTKLGEDGGSSSTTTTTAACTDTDKRGDLSAAEGVPSEGCVNERARAVGAKYCVSDHSHSIRATTQKSANVMAVPEEAALADLWPSSSSCASLSRSGTHCTAAAAATAMRPRCCLPDVESPGSPGSPGEPDNSCCAPPDFAATQELCTPWLQESCASCPGWSPSTPSPATAALAILCHEESTASCGPCLVLSPPFATGVSPTDHGQDDSVSAAETIDGGCSAPPFDGTYSPEVLGPECKKSALDSARCSLAPPLCGMHCLELSNGDLTEFLSEQVVTTEGSSASPLFEVLNLPNTPHKEGMTSPSPDGPSAPPLLGKLVSPSVLGCVLAKESVNNESCRNPSSCSTSRENHAIPFKLHATKSHHNPADANIATFEICCRQTEGDASCASQLCNTENKQARFNENDEPRSSPLGNSLCLSQPIEPEPVPEHRECPVVCGVDCAADASCKGTCGRKPWKDRTQNAWQSPVAQTQSKSMQFATGGMPASLCSGRHKAHSADTLDHNDAPWPHAQVSIALESETLSKRSQSGLDDSDSLEGTPCQLHEEESSKRNSRHGLVRASVDRGSPPQETREVQVATLVAETVQQTLQTGGSSSSSLPVASDLFAAPVRSASCSTGWLHEACHGQRVQATAVDAAAKTSSSADAVRITTFDSLGSIVPNCNVSGGPPLLTASVMGRVASHDGHEPSACVTGSSSKHHPGMVSSGAAHSTPSVAPKHTEAAVKIPGGSSMNSSECSTPVGPPTDVQHHASPASPVRRPRLELPVCRESTAHSMVSSLQTCASARDEESSQCEPLQSLLSSTPELECAISGAPPSMPGGMMSSAHTARAPLPPQPIDAAAATLALPLCDFLQRAQQEVAELDKELTTVMAEFRELLIFFAQPVAAEGAMRGVEPQNFFGHIWRFVEQLEAAAKERVKVEECLCSSGVACEDTGAQVA